MKRRTVVRLFLSYLNQTDIAIFVGTEICKEAYLYDRKRNIYIEEESGIGIAIATGLAMCTDKLVYVFCEDYYFLKEMAASVHMALSGCKNVYLVVLVSGEYQSSGHNSTIFNNINAPKSMMFNAGFLINDYTSHFKDVHGSKEIRHMLTYLKGPLFATINIDLGKDNKMDAVGITIEEQRNRLKEYLGR